MARISGVDLPRNKRMAIALTYIFGIGRTLALGILNKAGIDPVKRSQELTEGENPQRKWSAHFEHSVAITEGDPIVLSAL